MNVPPLAFLGLFRRLVMQEVASLAVHAETLAEECSAPLCLVFSVVVAILPELVGAVSELTLIIVGTIAHRQVVSAKLVLEFMIVGSVGARRNC